MSPVKHKRSSVSLVELVTSGVYRCKLFIVQFQILKRQSTTADSPNIIKAKNIRFSTQKFVK